MKTIKLFLFQKISKIKKITILYFFKLIFRNNNKINRKFNMIKEIRKKERSIRHVSLERERAKRKTGKKRNPNHVRK